MQLVVPTTEHLSSYLAARRAGFQWGLQLSDDAMARHLADVEADPRKFLAGLQDLNPVGRTVTLPDGSEVPRLPQHTRWMWDGEFAGIITFRFQPDTNELPPHVLGHIGYAVVESKRRMGYASQALTQILELPREMGLTYVEITTDVDNTASQGVILKCGGTLASQRPRPIAQGGEPLNYYVIQLQA